MVKSAAWGLVAGIITIAACLVPLNGFAHLSAFQVGWIAAAALASMAFTGYSTHATVNSAAAISRLDLTVTEIDLRAKNQAIALLAKVFSMCSTELVRVFAEPGLFDSVVDNSLTALHIAICRCHGLDESRVRVSLIIQPSPAGPELNGSPRHPDLRVRSVPGSRAPRFDFADDGIAEQLQAVMSRRHPYQNGWLWDGLDGSPARGEYHVLSPERDICSYIRVGIPDVGVLCVDCSDEISRLVVADRELVLAFADVLAIPGRAKVPLATPLPVMNPALRHREEAT